MVSAAKGAEEFYTIEEHASRTEGIEQARDLDTRAAEAWVGHPYVHLVDNSDSNFDAKINDLISKVAWSIGIDVGDRYLLPLAMQCTTILPAKMPFQYSKSSLVGLKH